MSTIRRCCLAFAVLLVIGVDVCLTRQSRGQVFTYTGPNNGSWQTAAFWAPFAPPFFVPPPSVGDAAIINVNRDILLNGNVFIADLSLSNGGDLLANRFLLDVGNVAGTAEADVIGTGSTGNNTELFVQPFNGIGIDYSLNVDVLNLENGGELDLVNDATAQITRRLNVDALSIITGQGTIRFTDEHNVAGRRFDLRGTLRPDANQTITLVAESGTLDLDGLVHNDNWVDLTNLGIRGH